METSNDCMRLGILLLCLTVAALSFTHCDARKMGLSQGHKYSEASIIKHVKKLKMMDLLLNQVADSANTQPYVNSPLTLPPYDSLPPQAAPSAFCIYPPNIPQTPSIPIRSPTGFGMPPPPPIYYFPPILPSLSPPPSPNVGVPTPIGEIPSPGLVPRPPDSFSTPNPPQGFPSPPNLVPSPTTYTPSPSGPIEPGPPGFTPTPPGFTPTPPGPTLTPPSPYYVPSPIGFEPSPPVFLPPIIYPSPPKMGSSTELWCVVKPTVPDPIVQEAMNYACGSGADCGSIQPGGACFEPNTLYAHASYAFNSYWQRTKLAGGSCEFGGTSMLVTVDPSFDGCHFVHE